MGNNAATHHQQFNASNINNSSYTADLTFTYADGKYSCVAWVYYLHIALAYLVTLFGLLAFLTRFGSRYHWLHVWFGRGFMVGMYWAMGTALLIHNTGLPLPIIVFFIIMLTSLSIGWIAIKFHSAQMEQKAFKNVSANLANREEKDIDLAALVTTEKIRIAESKSFVDRFFSYKALHGWTMALAWYQMAGRLIITNPDPAPGCWTYPAFKAEYPGGDAYFVSADGNQTLPPTPVFISFVTFPAIAVILAVGLIWSYCAGRKATEGYTAA